MRAAAACIEGATFESILMRAVFKSPLLVAYFSKKLTGAQHNYPTHDRELLAIVVALKKWHHYVNGKCTRVITDHSPFEYLHL